jgi:hypothetical protein
MNNEDKFKLMRKLCEAAPDHEMEFECVHPITVHIGRVSAIHIGYFVVEIGLPGNAERYELITWNRLQSVKILMS